MNLDGYRSDIAPIELAGKTARLLITTRRGRKCRVAKAGRKRKTPKQSRSILERFVRPTEAREMHNRFRSAGAAVRAIPPIEEIYSAGRLSEIQYLGLSRYADVASAAERSEVKSNIDFTVYGDGEGLPHFGVRMNIELGRLERELGSLREIARAICVEEMSLSQWAMNIGGSVMRERPGRGKTVIRWYEPRQKVLDLALLELRVAGARLAAAIGIC